MNATVKKETVFKFKEFEMQNCRSAMKISTDSILIGSWVDLTEISSAIDIGSGTGLLCLMLAQRGVDKITGVEIESNAYEESLINVSNSKWNERIDIINADVTDIGLKKTDLIISNPPYFDNKTSALASSDASRRYARHENKLTYRWLMENARNLLSPEVGRLCFISPSEREEEINYEAAFLRLNITRKCYIKSSAEKRHSRILWEIRPMGNQTKVETLVIRNNNEYTSEYINLTKDFYVGF